MNAAALRIGDQLILEEDYDETYIPSEQEIQEYAREIGIDPENEPELMWLAREGIVAPLPQEWKPCQDVTGDVYYFNFASGQSIWDHPCDEHYRNLVLLDREKLQAQGGDKKKEKKKKKDRKEKREKEPLKSTTVIDLMCSTVDSRKLVQGNGGGEDPRRGKTALNSPLTLVPTSQGGLAPLRGLGETPATTLRSSLGNPPGLTGGLEALKNSFGSSTIFGISKADGLTKSLLGSKQEEKISLNLPDFSEEEEISEEKSPQGTARLMKNLHIDVGILGDGFEYEESAEIVEDEGHDPVDEGTEPELQNLPASDEEAESHKEVSFYQSQGRSEPASGVDSESLHVLPSSPNKLSFGNELIGNCDWLEGKVDPQDESDGEEEEVEVVLMRASRPARLGRAAAIEEDEESEQNRSSDSRGSSADRSPVSPQAPHGVDLKSVGKEETVPDQAGVVGAGEEKGNELNEPIITDTAIPCINPDDSGNLPEKESDSSEVIKELQLSEDLEDEVDNSDCEIFSRMREKLLDVETLSSVLDLQPISEQVSRPEGERDGEKLNVEEEERRETLKAAKRHVQQELEDEQEREEPKSRSQKLAEELGCEVSREVERERARILQERAERLRGLRDELRQEEEEQAQQLYQDKESKLRLLREKLRTEREAEEARLKEEFSTGLLKLKVCVRRETEATEKEIREEKEATLQKLRDELDSLQATEQKRLEEKNHAFMEKLKKETDKALKEKKAVLEEKEKALGELRETLDKESKETLEQLQKRHSIELQELKTAAEEKHQKALSSLEKQLADAQHEKESELQADLQKAQMKMQQVVDYERELSDLLKAKREEVEKDHERKLEKMREEHQHVLSRIREEYEEEERQQRGKLLKQLQEEHERLTRLHEREITELRQALERRLEEMREAYGEKETTLKESDDQLEMRTKALNAKSNLLDNKEESLKLRAEQFYKEEEQLERQKAMQEVLVSQLTKQKVEQSTREHSTLQDSIRQTRRNLENLQEQQVELQTEVDLLHSERQRLQKRIGELEVTIKKKKESLGGLSAINGTSDPDPEQEDELHIEDLKADAKTSPRLLSSPVPRAEDDDISIDNVRYYISAEGVSIKKAKEFLTRQTRSLRKRQMALKSAKQQWKHDMRKAQQEVQDPESSQILQDVWENLQQETQHLDEMKSTMRKGQVLLRKKEERLNQLESSLAEGLSDEDTLKGSGGKKAVKFDLTDSDDISSIVSIDLPQVKTEKKTEMPLHQHAKVQYLSESLHRITSDLNNVLGMLGSLGTQHSLLFDTGQAQAQSVPPPRDSVPLSVYASLARVQSRSPFLPPGGPPLPSPWAWSSRGSSASLSLPAAQSVDDALNEKWHKYFPGGIPSLSGNAAPLESRLGYISASDQIKLLHQSHSRHTEGDSRSVQGMIDANKKWLENFKKDPKVPLFARTSKVPSSHGLVQLGLDENNQIKVYHY
eukprot:gi/632980328/ref/XP_007906973.1/ PREDICTED: centrosomal protein of 164 kDa isoform X1 [Callorhinchus milii]